jgi:hypothetical protein
MAVAIMMSARALGIDHNYRDEYEMTVRLYPNGVRTYRATLETAYFPARID